MDARPATDNPLGLNLDFLHGRGYLWAHAENVSNWVTLKNLRMEIPDLSFPFDVRGGLSRFRDTRCLIREIDLEVSEIGVADLVQRAASEVEGFTDVEVRFLDGVVLFGARVNAFGVDSFMTFRLAALPADEETTTVRLLAHDFRAYGPLPCPVMQLGHTFLRRLLQSDAVETSFAPSLDGDTVEVRPLKLLLLHVFGRRGWKLPNTSSVDMSDLILRPGAARLSARSDDDTWIRETSTGEMANRHLAAALAADEARMLFADGDAAAFAGRPEQALRTYQSFQDRYRLHPGLVSRLLDVLLATPNPANLSEARSLCSDLQNRDDDSLVAALGRARIAEIDEETEQTTRAYSRLITLLEARGDTLDRAYCTVIAARSVAAAKPDEAIGWLTGVLRGDPRNLAALRELQKIYERTGQWADLEDILKRLTGIEQERDSLIETYLSLARHLMTRQGEVAEARTFLERARRIAPNDFQILDALSAAWVMSGDAARGIKTLGDAAKAAKAHGDTATASRLLFRTARLWHDALDNVDQALMQVRRAIEQWDEGDVDEPLELAKQLRYAARLCNWDGQQGEAIAYWTEALAALQLAEARAEGDGRVEARRALAATHRDIAAVYRANGRHDVAANHERRLVEMDPTDVEAIDALEEHYRNIDDVERFVAVLSDAIDRIGPNPESLALRTRLAERYMELDRIDDAARTLEDALLVAPGSARVRQILTTFLVDVDEGPRLKAILSRLRHRVQQRDLQWTLAVELGDLCVDTLGEPDAAARAYADASRILPARREAYTWCRFVLERLAQDRGWDGESPLGNTLGEDLIALWQRLAETAPSADERAALLDEISDLAVQMGDGERARTAIRERQALGTGYPGRQLEDEPTADEGSEPEVGASESLVSESDWSDPELVALGQESSVQEFVRNERTRMVASSFDVADGNETSAPWKDDASSAPPEPDDTADDTADDGTDVDPPVAAFRKEFDQARREPPALPKIEDLSADSSLARVLKRAHVRRSRPEASSEEEDASIDEDASASSDSPSTEELEAKVTAARKSQNTAELADALEALLEVADLTDGRRAELIYELSETLYYELEDNDRALDWLLEVRELDPSGYGARPGVLNAIEAIYEERGSVDGRIEILRTRLDRSESPEMADTYRLLIAQLEWQERADADAARRWLDEVIERDDRHEGAHRLLADIDEEAEEWKDAAEHLRIALSVSGEGLDSLELEKRLARLLLNRLDDPKRALTRFQHVLSQAPGDAAVLEGIRASQAAMGDWEGVAESLREELRLLLGYTLPGDPETDWVTEIDPSTVARPLRMPASQVLADLARISEEELEAPERAHLLWGFVVELFPEHAEALERRIDLARMLEDHDALAADLETYASMLLDWHARLDALLECARIRGEEMGDWSGARELLKRTLQQVEELAEAPSNVDEARETLQSWAERQG